MFNALIPLEIECALQISKLIYTLYVGVDGWMTVPDYVTKGVKQCKVRNMNMIEELGEIQYLFCDKTGTLTQNELAFRAFSIANNQKVRYEGTTAQIKEALQKEKGGDSITQAFFTCINTNHECITIESKVRPGTTDFSGPSVDEVAFLDMAREVGECGYFLDRDSQNIEIQTPEGSSTKYKLLKYFAFTSERKASSVVVRDQEDRLFAFVKGADSSMKNFFKADADQTFIDEEVEGFAAQGLRTLVFGYKEIDQKVLDQFENNHKQRQVDLQSINVWDWD